MTATVYIQGKDGKMRGRRGGPGILPPTVARTPPRSHAQTSTADADESVDAVMGRFRAATQGKGRYAGLAVRTSEPPEWSVPEHRAALQASGVRLVSVDVETTSLDVREGGVTEIGWFDINDGIGGGFVPPHSIDGATPKALEISRYHERIAGQPMSADQVAHLHRILGGDGSHVELVGSYPNFDMKHLNQLFAEHGLKQSPWGRHPIDVGAAYYWVSEKPIGSRGGLAAAAEEFGVDNSGHHDAYSDATVAAHVWHEMETRRAKSAIPPF